ncbi:MAG TPA: hypothetical protein VIN10_10000 [Bacteroidales bacterium]
MSEIFVIIFTTTLAIALFAVAFAILQQFNRHNKHLSEHLKSYQDLMLKKIEADNKQQTQKATVSLRLQAYERMVLFLERINPPNLLIRVSPGNKKAADLQNALLRAIRDEYEHNLSQQLFVSGSAWELIKTAKEEVVKSVNLAAATVKADDPANVYAQEVMTKWFSNKDDAVEKALNSLKEDVRNNF